MIRIFSHDNPDLDAIMSVAAIIYLNPTETYSVEFNSQINPAVHDGISTFVVDMGHTPMDHHQFKNPRSECAFRLVCRHFMRHGANAKVRQHAQALLERIGPAVFRQDSTGSLDPQRRADVNVLGLGELVKAAVWKLQDGQKVFWRLYPAIEALFEAEVAKWQASAMCLADVGIEATLARHGHVVGLESFAVVGEFSPLMHTQKMAFKEFPDAVLCVYVVRWYRQNQLYTISRGVGRKDGSKISVRNLLDEIMPDLSGKVREEVGRWYREHFFSGKGTNTHPDSSPVPQSLIRELLQNLDEKLEEKGHDQ